MARLKALWRDTKYLILFLIAFGLGAAWFKHPLAILLIPITLLPLVYFAMNRYDDQGNDREN